MAVDMSLLHYGFCCSYYFYCYLLLLLLSTTSTIIHYFCLYQSTISTVIYCFYRHLPVIKCFCIWIDRLIDLQLRVDCKP